MPRFNRRRMRRRYRRRVPRGFRRRRTVDSLAGRIYNYRCFVAGGSALVGNPATGATAIVNIAPELEDINDLTSFQNIYDEYRILAFKVILTSWNPNVGHMDAVEGAGAGATQLAAGELLSVITVNRSWPTTMSEAREFQTCKTYPINKSMITRYIKYPVARAGIEDDTPAIVAGQKIRSPWISTANPDVWHYGVSFLYGNYDQDNVRGWNVNIVYYIQFRNVS